MPFPFPLPTTHSFSFSRCVHCESHPSLPISASSHRGVVKDSLKKHKRLPPPSRVSNVATVASNLQGYIPYLLAIISGLDSEATPRYDPVHARLVESPAFYWRPTLSDDGLAPGRSRVKATTFEHELAFALSSLAVCQTVNSRSSLQPLHDTNAQFLGNEQRVKAITTASKQLVEAASIWTYAADRSERSAAPAPVDITPSTLRALASLAHAEATLLAVLKDDPYPAIVAQDRNKHDKDWMFKSPDIPKVRAHAFARLCLAASEHAARAVSLLRSGDRINTNLIKYIDDLKKTSRAKACRFFGIDAELGGGTAEGIGWLRAGLQELGVEVKESVGKGLSLSRFKKEFTEKREDKKVEKESAWGADAGRLEETRVIEMLSTKWNKINDTMNTQAIPPANQLLMKMPSGRDILVIKPYEPPALGGDALEAMRVAPDRPDEPPGDISSDDEYGGPSAPVGAFPGTSGAYSNPSRAASTSYY